MLPLLDPTSPRLVAASLLEARYSVSAGASPSAAGSAGVSSPRSPESLPPLEHAAVETLRAAARVIGHPAHVSAGRFSERHITDPQSIEIAEPATRVEVTARVLDDG